MEVISKVERRAVRRSLHRMVRCLGVASARAHRQTRSNRRELATSSSKRQIANADARRSPKLAMREAREIAVERSAAGEMLEHDASAEAHDCRDRSHAACRSDRSSGTLSMSRTAHAERRQTQPRIGDCDAIGCERASASNENKISDRGRGRASQTRVGLEVMESVNAERPAVRCIAWLDACVRSHSSTIRDASQSPNCCANGDPES